MTKSGTFPESETIAFVASIGFLLLVCSSTVITPNLTDDFWYYYVVARNFVDRGSMSFDGTHLTNGFHPLWFTVISVVYLLSQHSDAVALRTISALSIALPIIGAIKVRQFLKPFAKDKTGIWIVWAVSIFYAAAGVHISFAGMEVALTLGLFPWLLAALASPSYRSNLFLLTLLATSVILSRIDCLLIVGIIWLSIAYRTFPVGTSLQSRIRRWLKAETIPVVLGAFPLIAYLTANILIFGSALPQSAVAKALTIAPGPYWDLLVLFSPEYKFGMILGLIYLTYLSITVFALWTCKERILIWALIIIWPLIFYCLLAMRSPWPLWSWYEYPIVACSPAVARIATGCNSRQHGLLAVLLGPAVAVFLAVSVWHVKYFSYDPWSNPINRAALMLKDFAATHPGTYAMGDRAGVVGYLLQSPVLQLEGLVGGREVLAAIDRQDDLVSFLREHNVMYYVSTDAKKDEEGCFFAVEPAKAGEKGKHMVGRICAEPIFEFSLEDKGKLSTTRVFKMSS